MLGSPMMGSPVGGFGTEVARTKFIPSLGNCRFVMEHIDKELVWNKDISGHAALRIPVPADHQMDLQTFFFGPMTHSLYLRPRRYTPGCCSCTTPYTFDLATEPFGSPIATGEVSKTCMNHHCPCLPRDVSVKLPSGPVTGVIGQTFCGIQLRQYLEWSSGETMSYRYPPCCIFCGPWRTGYVGTVPGEEENHIIRYWDTDGQFIECSLYAILLSCLAPCRKECLECKESCCDLFCRSKFYFTSWHFWTLREMRELLMHKYSYKLRSTFGEAEYRIEGDDVVVDFKHPMHYTDINGLGNWRIAAHKQCMCCKIIMSDSTDNPTNIEMHSSMDLTFRGTLNQNVLDQKDFNLALGYLVLRFFNYMVMQEQGKGHFGPTFGLGSYSFRRGLMKPRDTEMYASPPPPMMMAPPPPLMGGGGGDFL